MAFVRPGPALGSMHLWLRAPDGTERQLSAHSGARPRIEALTETGEIVFSTYDPGSVSHVRRSIAFPDERILDLGQ